MKRYELKKIADGGLLYLEESDIQAVRPRRKDASTPVELELRNRAAYRLEDGFRYNARSGTVVIGLSVRQAQELIDQDRSAQGKEFCGDAEGHGCFDFGKSIDPEDCARCRVLLALHQAGQGDRRKIRIPLPVATGRGLAIAFVLILLLWWWTLCSWSWACRQVETLRVELAAVRSKQAPGYPPGSARSRLLFHDR